MPIERRLRRTNPEEKNELARLLHHEWTKPKKTGQPRIIIEGEKRQPMHIYVIWDKWAERTQTERSEIIMDVVENLAGPDAIPGDSPITVAMGLTVVEAKRMGIKSA